MRKNDSFIYLGMLVENLFHITPNYLSFIVENNHVSLKRKTPSMNQTYLWHLCLGHINLNRIKRLVNSRVLCLIVPEDLSVCESCIEGKMTKRPFIAKRVRAKYCLELVHTCVWTI